MPAGYVRELSLASAKLDAIFLQLEDDILQDIVRRIAKAGKVTSSADWQALRLQLIGNSSQDIKAMLQKAAGISAQQVDQLFNQAAQEAYTRDAGLYTATGRKQIPYDDNQELRQLVNAMGTQTAGTLENITGTTGFMLPDASGRLQFTPTADILNLYLDKNVTAVLSGAFDYNTMIRRTVAELTGSGLRSVDYANGRSNRVDVAARRAMLTAYGQITSQVAFSNAQQLGTDLFEVSWHPDARPDHQKWQGKVYTRRELETVCGYGTVAGLCGANCRHDFGPYIEGVSRRQWSDKELQRLNKQENTPRNYKGKDYTDYEATQQQRKLETNMRAYRERIELLKLARADKADITAARAKYQALRAQYKDFSKAFDLPGQWERVYTGRTRGRV